MVAGMNFLSFAVHVFKTLAAATATLQNDREQETTQ